MIKGSADAGATNHGGRGCVRTRAQQTRAHDVGAVVGVRVFDIEVERCAYGGKRKLIAVIEEAAVIEKIVKHR